MDKHTELRLYKCWSRVAVILPLRVRAAIRRIVVNNSPIIPILFKRYHTTRRVIGLEFISNCTLRCDNCEASCAQAPSDESLSLGQIEKFVSELIALKWKCDMIKVRGGEPTLHAHFFKALDILNKYKKIHSGCVILIQTNGHGKATKEILSRLPAWVEVDNSHKEKGAIPNFSGYNIAPVDSPAYRLFADFEKGCERTSICNMALSRYGYYPCSPGANVDRIFGLDIGIKELAKVSPAALKRQLAVLCKYCGHYKKPNEVLIGKKSSITWQKAYGRYMQKRPKLSEY